MGADGTISREDLRAKLAEADEKRVSLRRALRGRPPRARGGAREAEEGAGALAERSSAMRGMGLRHLPPRDRRTVYGVLRVTAHADEKGDVRITGVFDADIAELLPTSWAAARASARDHNPRINPRLPTSHKGIVSVRHSRPGTSSPQGRRGL